MKQRELESKSTQCSNCELSRRSFLQIAAAGAGVLLVGGCASSTPDNSPPAGTTENPIAATPQGKEFKITGGAKLATGQALAFTLPDKSPGLIFADKTGALKALSAVCTHSGCTVKWENGGIACPCHGSKFTTDGKVVTGPAKRPLPAFTVRKEGDDALLSKA